MPLPAHHRRLVHALSRTLFPRGSALGVDGDDADVEGRFAAWFDRLPPMQRGALLGALGAFDLGFRGWSGRAGAAFAFATTGERAAYVEACQDSAPFAVRQGFEALRLALIAAYVDSPAVASAIGAGDVVALARARAGAPG